MFIPVWLLILALFFLSETFRTFTLLGGLLLLVVGGFGALVALGITLVAYVS